MQINNKERDLYSIMLHEVVFENQKAIYDLVKLGHYGSALLCVLFEAHVKGIWLYLCTTEKQICQFKQDRIKYTS